MKHSIGMAEQKSVLWDLSDIASHAKPRHSISHYDLMPWNDSQCSYDNPPAYLDAALSLSLLLR